MCQLRCTAKFAQIQTVQKAQEEPHVQFLDRVEEDCDEDWKSEVLMQVPATQKTRKTVMVD